jgi:hypothetical protein
MGGVGGAYDQASVQMDVLLRKNLQKKKKKKKKKSPGNGRPGDCAAKIPSKLSHLYG